MLSMITIEYCCFFYYLITLNIFQTFMIKKLLKINTMFLKFKDELQGERT